MYRVVFPFELKLRNTTDDCLQADHEFALFGVVVHVGSGPNHGALLAAALSCRMGLVHASSHLRHPPFTAGAILFCTVTDTMWVAESCSSPMLMSGALAGSLT